MFRKSLIALLGCLLCTASYAIQQFQIPTSDVGKSASTNSRKLMSQYRNLFARLSVFEARARQREERGISGESLRTKTADALRLTPEENRVLQEISTVLFNSVAELDAEAREVIRVERIQQTYRLQNGIDRIPHAPPILGTLQEAKDKLYLMAREHLRASIGDARFDEFELQLDALLKSHESLDYLHIGRVSK